MSELTRILDSEETAELIRGVDALVALLAMDTQPEKAAAPAIAPYPGANTAPVEDPQPGMLSKGPLPWAQLTEPQRTERLRHYAKETQRELEHLRRRLAIVQEMFGVHQHLENGRIVVPMERKGEHLTALVPESPRAKDPTQAYI